MRASVMRGKSWKRRSQLEAFRRRAIFRQIRLRVMQRHLTMSRKLHEFLDANAGQFGRAAERHAPFPKQFQRQKLRGAARGGTNGQAGQRQDFFGYVNSHVCHRATKIAQRAAFVKLIFEICEQRRAVSQ